MKFTALLSTAILGASIVNAQAAPSLTDLLSSTSELSTLTSVILQFPDLVKLLVDFPTNLTIVAPSNAAFAEFLKKNTTSTPPAENTPDNTTLTSILAYHVLNGTFYSSAFVDGKIAAARTLLSNNPRHANLGLDVGQVVLGRRNGGKVELASGLGSVAVVEKANIEFDGGVVHIIDSVLELPQPISVTAAAANLTALAAALVKTNLLDTVDKTPSLTVFAPRNAAFQAIGNLLGSISDKDLASVLTYHVVAGPPLYSLPGAADGDVHLKTLQGGSVTVHENEGGWFVNGARIIGGNTGGVLVGNGIVYVIDNVLNPSYGNLTTTYAPNPTLSTQPPSFPSASFVTTLPFVTSNGTMTATGTSTPTGGAGSGSSNIRAAPLAVLLVAPIAVIGGMML
ncbi:FAS1 domain-containing protein [Peziza echinospora]|nr:FAS1 domain-containing protein [Peziza echinospora]